MTAQRLLGAALTVPVLIGALVLMTAGPAVACSCAIVRSEAERVTRADAVFVGTLVSQVERIDQKARELMRSSDPAVWNRGYRSDSSRAVWTFQVSRVYKGAVGKRQEIVTSVDPPAGTFSSCQVLKFSRPGPFLVFAYNSAGDMYRLEPGQYASNICSGSRALADGGEPVLGGLSAREARGSDSSSSSTRGGLSAGELSESDSSSSSTRGGLSAGEPSGSDSSPSPASLAIGVGVLAAAVAAGLGLATLRARRRASAD